jgi:hypothetical protein
MLMDTPLSGAIFGSAAWTNAAHWLVSLAR